MLSYISKGGHERVTRAAHLDRVAHCPLRASNLYAYLIAIYDKPPNLYWLLITTDANKITMVSHLGR